ncbi:TetR/AcrR family transcriptional regulator [Streptomyces flaveolus]|uniref:TetR/AcrR family transcriptional regulator n=1 Tax=Streptomyces flaveolus TaxID=67297 RepID=A0ABV1VES3_9ACTN
MSEQGKRQRAKHDRAATTRALLDAATAEFAEHGIGGARIDRIAERAGSNKAQIYAYLGNKEQLFARVLAEQSQILSDAVPVDSSNVADYGQRLFDFFLSHREMVSLIVFEGRHFDPLKVPDRADRADYYGSRRATFARACAGNADGPSAFFLLMAAANWYFAAPQIVSMVFGDPQAAETIDRYRRFLGDLGRSLQRGDASQESTPDQS